MAEPGACELRLDRVLAAERRAVYRALTSPALLAAWWGPAGYRVPDLDFDPRPGREYRITMKPPDGDAFELRGEFREVEPPARLAYTFRWQPPDPDDRETLVRLTLVERGAETELHVVHSGFATEARRTLHEGGWSESLDRLEALLGGEPG